MKGIGAGGGRSAGQAAISLLGPHLAGRVKEHTAARRRLAICWGKAGSSGAEGETPAAGVFLSPAQPPSPGAAHVPNLVGCTWRLTLTKKRMLSLETMEELTVSNTSSPGLSSWASAGSSVSHLR